NLSRIFYSNKTISNCSHRIRNSVYGVVPTGSSCHRNGQNPWSFSTKCAGVQNAIKEKTQKRRLFKCRRFFASLGYLISSEDSSLILNCGNFAFFLKNHQ